MKMTSVELGRSTFLIGVAVLLAGCNQSVSTNRERPEVAPEAPERALDDRMPQSTKDHSMARGSLNPEARGIGGPR